MSETLEIVHCRWCSSKAMPRYLDRTEWRGWVVCCTFQDCLLSGPVCDTKEAAIAAWNVGPIRDMGDLGEYVTSVFPPPKRLRLWRCDGHDEITLSGHSVVLAESEDQARDLLRATLQADGLLDNQPLILLEIPSEKPIAVVIFNGEY